MRADGTGCGNGEAVDLDRTERVLGNRVTELKEGTEGNKYQPPDHVFGGTTRGALLVIAAISFAVVVAGGWVGAHVYRVSSAAKSLEELDADYVWLHQRYEGHFLEERNGIRKGLVRVLGNRVASDVAEVRISNGNPNDLQLDFLAYLPQLRSLELQSAVATDRTLAVISQLPNLRYLKLVGPKFTVMGLLQLRNAPKLQKLYFDREQFTPIEMAVLQAELPGVDFSSIETGDASNYPTPAMVAAPPPILM